MQIAMSVTGARADRRELNRMLGKLAPIGQHMAPDSLDDEIGLKSDRSPA
jgi:hypothetical protein